MKSGFRGVKHLLAGNRSNLISHSLHRTAFASSLIRTSYSNTSATYSALAQPRRAFASIKLSSVSGTSQPQAKSTSQSKEDKDDADVEEESAGSAIPAPLDPEIVKPDEFLVTDACVAAIKRVRNTKGDVALRITVDTGGCSGFQYQFTLPQLTPPSASASAPIISKSGNNQSVTFDGTDYTFQRDGVTVLVDDISLPFLRGAHVDYKSELIRSGFAVRDNPNVELACGCGTSFAKKSGKL